MTWLNIISSSSLGLFILMKQTEGRALRNGNDEEQSLPLLTESTGLEHLEPGSIIHVEPTNTDKHTQVNAGVIGRDVHPDSETIIDVINYEQDFTQISLILSLRMLRVSILTRRMKSLMQLWDCMAVSGIFSAVG